MSLIQIDPDGLAVNLHLRSSLVDGTARNPAKPLMRVAADGIHIVDACIVDRRVGELWADAYRHPGRAALRRHKRRLLTLALLAGFVTGATKAATR